MASITTRRSLSSAATRSLQSIGAVWSYRRMYASYEVLASTPQGGIAHWHVTYQVASEELFQIWAKSTGTNLVARKPGDPLPRMVLDGMLIAEFEGSLCSKCEIWWHSMPQASWGLSLKGNIIRIAAFSTLSDANADPKACMRDEATCDNLGEAFAFLQCGANNRCFYEIPPVRDLWPWHSEKKAIFSWPWPYASHSRISRPSLKNLLAG